MVGREREYCDAGRVVAISYGSETGPGQGGHDPREPPSLARSVGSVWHFGLSQLLTLDSVLSAWLAAAL